MFSFVPALARSILLPGWDLHCGLLSRRHQSVSPSALTFPDAPFRSRPPDDVRLETISISTTTLNPHIRRSATRTPIDPVTPSRTPMEQPVILIDGGTPHRPTPQEPSPPREHPSPPSYPQFLSPDHALSPVQRVGSLLSPGSRSRTSSRVKKGGRPGTAAVQPSRPPSTTPEPTLRRVQSLDDSILPSHRARSLTAEDDEIHHVDLIGQLPGAESPTSSEGSPSSTLAALPCVSDAPSGSSGKHGSESWLRLWHMFMELLVTERSYLYDLRILVHVSL